MESEQVTTNFSVGKMVDKKRGSEGEVGRGVGGNNNDLSVISENILANFKNENACLELATFDIQKNGSLNVTDSKGRTLLMKAVLANSEDDITHLL